MNLESLSRRSLLQLVLISFAALPGRALAHGSAPLGPKGGRLVEFSTDESLRGEVTLQDGRFFVELLGRNLQPVPLAEQTLTVVGGDRANPQRPAVTREDNRFVFPALKGSRYLLVLQFRSVAAAKPVTARFEFDAAVCGSCKSAEWLCRCPAEPPAKKP